jgi:hypothetical protein
VKVFETGNILRYRENDFILWNFTIDSSIPNMALFIRKQTISILNLKFRHFGIWNYFRALEIRN